jgi:exo-beta-1,3-glucanase (GH17 family)/cellulose synthase/poly-beta-1,6-N-acetylglucosamine synthase-like glycosyltransferase
MQAQARAAWWKAITLAAIVCAINVLLWSLEHRPRQLEAVSGKLYGMAYAPFQRDQSPLLGQFPSAEQIRTDLRLIAPFTSAIRTYTSSEIPNMPGLAAEFGLKVNAGAWIDNRLDNNRVELNALYGAVARYPNINRVIVGNEAILRGNVSIEQMSAYLDEARAKLEVPVSTAENWDLWLNRPELAQHVDYIAVHLLPYWEGVNRKYALLRALDRLTAIRAKFPNKTIVVGEFGWPSAGERFQNGEPSTATQARFVRQFANRANALGIDYYLMEAFDQPWKQNEGRVGAYWGMFDANRQQKWTLTGPVQEDPFWLSKALIAAALALLPIIFFARRFGRFKWWGRFFFACLLQSGTALLVWLIGVPSSFYLSALDWTMFLIMLPAQLAIIAIMWIAGFEFTEAVAQKHWLRRFALWPLKAGDPEPMVSIHLPCHNEPPDMVILTLNSIAALDYQNFEVLVLDNNTEKDEIWQPVQAHCELLGPKFKFYHLRPWPGYKAGALNFALGVTDAKAEIVAVVDSDYEVRADWLKGLVQYFKDPKVAIVQCPQAHRDFEDNAFRRICNFEYDGFFRIGMHHRNERNAIIQHGTMTMVRTSALREVDGWAEWCICEDAELGLKLMNAGYQTNYVDEVMGRGLTPADFTAYKSQRFRWAFGAMQILKAHIKKMTRKSGLDLGQRYHFLTGWFGWFADALHLVFTLMALFWTTGMLIDRELFAIPLELFLIPVLGFCVLKAVFGIVLYRVRVPCTWKDCLGASLASMALSHAIARGILKGLTSNSHPFERTAKSRRLRRKPNAISAVREESLILLGLITAFIGVCIGLGGGAPEVQLWLAILVSQALPYASAVLTAIIAARSGERMRRAGA